MEFGKIVNIIGKHRTNLIFVTLSFLALLFAKRYFFISFFILANYFILWLKYGYGLDSPIEIISFGTFMCSYIYGTKEAMIVAGSSLIALSLTGRMKTSKLITQSILFLIAFIGPLFRIFQVPIAGLLILCVKYFFDILINIIFLHDIEYFKKIPQKSINIIFWIIIYLRFADNIANLMTI
jgi:hypothetical protein